MTKKPDRKPGPERPIVFLHIPKTAGQTIHHVVGGVVGQAQISPIRVHTQAKSGETQFPPGFSFYSGHLDWIDLQQLPQDRFVFTVLRDPRERFASFYFFLRKEAKQLTADALQLPGNLGKYRVLNHSADDYFFSEEPAFRRFIHDHYDNFYCAYFATKQMRGYAQMQHLSVTEKVERALANTAYFSRIYHLSQLPALEDDLRMGFDVDIRVANKFLNQGNMPVGQKRWPALLERFESDAHRLRLESFVNADLEFMAQLGLPSEVG